MAGSKTATLVAAALLLSCGSPEPSTLLPPIRVGVEPSSLTAQLIELTADPAVDPCDDLYRYACGGFLDQAASSDPGRLWTFASAGNDERARRLDGLFRASAAAPSSADEALVGAAWAACMDTDAIEEAGASPLDALIAGIDSAGDRAALMRRLGELHAAGFSPLFAVDAAPSSDVPERHVLLLSQGGLGLDDAALYDDADLRRDYAAHIARMLEVAAISSGRADLAATRVVELERRLAALHLPTRDARDPRNWRRLPAPLPAAWWEGLGVETRPVELAPPDYFEGLARLLETTPVEALADYLRWSVLDTSAGWLHAPLRDEQADFRDRRMLGLVGREERERTCRREVPDTFRGPVSRALLARYPDHAAHAGALRMAEGARSVLTSRVQAADWLDDATRDEATAKVRGIELVVGRADRRVEGLDRAPPDAPWGALVLAERAARAGNWHALLDRPTDRRLVPYDMTARTAWYLPTSNALILPAGRIAFPWYGLDRELAVNHGGTGPTLGHEMSHALDPNGRHRDASGRVGDWWSASSSAAYDDRAACFRRQLDGREVLPGVPLDPDRVLYEAVADSEGLAVAWQVFVAEPEGADLPDDLALTADQLFFVSWAQTWCAHAPEAMLRTLAASDPHAPIDLRVNLPARNLPAYAAAFSCPAGRPMAPEDRCRLW